MLKLVYAPDPILKKECQPLAQVDDHHRTLIKEMYEVMYEANGVGLAAPQVGLDMRIFIICLKISNSYVKSSLFGLLH